LHLLTEASRAAKGPEDRLPLIHFALDLADYAQATQMIEDLPKLANMAESLARSINNKELKVQVMSRATELQKAADDFGPVSSARRRLAEDPANPAASLIDGKYRALVEGDWPAGLKLLAQSDHAALSAAARQDLAGPSDNVKAAAIGDLWFDIAAADPALSGAYARAQHWYKQAAAAADGLEKVRLEKRLEQIAAMNLPSRLTEPPSDSSTTLASARYLLTRQKAFEPTNLLSVITPQTVRTAGWNIYPDMLRVDNDSTWARLQSPVNPTGEYQMALRVRRYTTTPTSGMFVIGLPHPRSQFLMVIDYPVAGRRFASFVTLSSYKRFEDNPTLQVTENALPRLGMAQQHIVICAVKHNEVVVLLDGQKLAQYRGDMSKLTMPKEWAVPDPRSMFLGAHQGGFYIHGWGIAPLHAKDGTELPLASDPLDSLFGPANANRIDPAFRRTRIISTP
jgi:hypothetical protein